MQIMNSLLVDLGIESWKPIIATLLLPPVPLLLIVALGAVLLWKQRRVGWLLTSVGVAGLWLCACTGVAEFLTAALLRPPAALQPAQIETLRRDVQAKRKVAIVVLGGGLKGHASEYDAPALAPLSLERLAYATWLAGRTEAPLVFTGGVGWAGKGGSATEAEIGSRVASTQFNRSLRWSEHESRDTRENATNTVAMMKRHGMAELVLVTHGWHMPRSMRAFDQAAQGQLRITAAPMGVAPSDQRLLLRWMPTSAGLADVRHVLHELLGLLAGS